LQEKKEKHAHHHHHHHHRHHKKSTSEDLLVPTGSTESPNAEQYSMLLQTSASASDISSAANGPAAVVNIKFIVLQLFKRKLNPDSNGVQYNLTDALTLLVGQRK